MGRGGVIVIPYRPRPQQREVHELMKEHRFGVLVCHRRMGKTVLATNELLRGALLCKKERPRFAYIAPTYRQGKATAWDYLVHFTATVPDRQVNQSELRVDLPNGGQVRIYGADNPDSLRGLYFDGAVLDEYGLHASNVYSEVVSACLVDRGGWAMFMGTPNGRNQFWHIRQHALAQIEQGSSEWFFREYRASDTGLLDQEYLAAARSTMTEDEYAQEFECSFEAAVRGAVFGKEIQQARLEGRITNVPLEPALPVDTTWDIGVGDATAIWFSQTLRSGEIRLIDYYEASGEGLPHYVRVLQDRKYVYGKHWAPHDIQVRDFSSGRSRIETAAGLGLRFDVVPRLHLQVGGEIEEGIHAARMLFSRCWFDATKCAAGIEALQHYRRDFNERLQEFKSSVVHDWASHGADAFRYLAVRLRPPVEPRSVSVPQTYAWT